VLAKRLVLKAGANRKFTVGENHLNALVSQDPEPTAGCVGARIVGPDDHPTDPGTQDRVGARRRAAVVAAGLE
jgi:hypothetical protein